MQKLTIAELDAQAAELLPGRETLYLDTNWAAIYASNSSMAVNAATMLSDATSSATQNISVYQ